MNVSLPPELDQFVSSRVASGDYASPSDVVSEALHLLESQEQDRSVRLAAFNEELEERLAALDRGEHFSPEEVRAYLEQHAREYRQERA